MLAIVAARVPDIHDGGRRGTARLWGIMGAAAALDCGETAEALWCGSAKKGPSGAADSSSSLAEGGSAVDGAVVRGRGMWFWEEEARGSGHQRWMCIRQGKARRGKVR